MANNLRAFLRPNAEQVGTRLVAASCRFRDDNGQPMQWEIGCISADEYSRIRSECIRNVQVPGKKNQFTQQLDAYAFQAKIAARCTVFPDLMDAELQSSWGAASPHELLGKMLIGGEFDDYVTAIFELNGFKTDAEAVEEAKN